MAFIIIPAQYGASEAIVDFCGEHDIPHLVVTGHQYKTLTNERMFSLMNYHWKKKLRVVTPPEIIHYCDIWTDKTIELEENYLTSRVLEDPPIKVRDQEHLAELLCTEDYLFIYGLATLEDPQSYEKTRDLLNQTYDIIKQDGNLSDLRKVKAVSNPLYFRLQKLREMDKSTT